MTTWTTMRTVSGAICLAGILSMGEPAKATEFGVSSYILGLTLPMSGYTTAAGRFISWTRLFFIRAAVISSPQPAPRVARGSTRDIVADIGSSPVSGLKLFGADPGFAVTVLSSQEPNYSGFTVAAPWGRPNGLAAPGEIAGIRGYRIQRLLGSHAGEHHWNVMLTGFAPTGNFDSNRCAAGLNRPALDSQGGLYVHLVCGPALSSRAPLA